MTFRSQCTCACHRGGMLHCVPCCAPDPEPTEVELRMAKLREAGYVMPSDAEVQATLDQTITSLEQDRE